MVRDSPWDRAMPTELLPGRVLAERLVNASNAIKLGIGQENVQGRALFLRLMEAVGDMGVFQSSNLVAFEIT
jgi:hypothetical protein